MDECCLVFELTLSSSSSSYQQEHFLEYVLYRDDNPGINFEANFINLDSNLTIQEQAKAVKAYSREIYSLRDRLPNSFPDALVELMKWRGLTVEVLAEMSMASPKTI